MNCVKVVYIPKNQPTNHVLSATFTLVYDYYFNT